MSRVDKGTGEVCGVVTYVCNKVNSLTVPAGFYNQKRASNAVGMYYERYVAFVLGGSRVFNPNAQCPDVQLSSRMPEEQNLLFEVKAGHRTNGIVLKERQLEIFSEFGNCFYAVVFHQSDDIQKRWDKGTTTRKVIRKELETPSSFFIVPAHLMLEFYAKNEHRKQPMPHYQYSNEYYISMKESHMKTTFADYETHIPKVIDDDRGVYVMSDKLTIDQTRTKHPFVIRI